MLLIGFFFLAGCGTGKPTKSEEPPSGGAIPKSSDGPQDSKNPSGAGGEDFVLTATEFHEANKDSKVADAKYKGKMVELSGQVKTVVTHFGKETSVWLKSEKGGLGVNCMFDGTEVVGKVGIGQTVRIRGRAWVASTLKSCELLEKGPDTILRVTAVELAKEYSADPEKTEEKYKDRTLLVSAEVAAVEATPGIHLKDVVLKGDGKTKVRCLFDNSEEVERRKPGEQIILVGEFQAINKSSISVHSCNILKK